MWPFSGGGEYTHIFLSKKCTHIFKNQGKIKDTNAENTSNENNQKASFLAYARSAR